MSAIEKKLLKVKKASVELKAASSARKNAVLEKLAEKLRNESEKILKANSADIKLAKGATPAFQDRLALNSDRINQMARSLLDVAHLDDPVGEVADEHSLANGLNVKKERSPLGVIMMIFESRPNVAVEAFSIAFKAGNAVILRGGSESQRSTEILYKLIRGCLAAEGFSEDCIWGISNPDRKLVKSLLSMNNYIDVVVPRGGEGLINFVSQNTKIPVIKHDRGLCHVYIHEDADLKMAVDIVKNAKVQRPSACNSMETLLVHENVARELLPMLFLELVGVTWFGCSKTLSILGTGKSVQKVTKKSYDTEYLDLKMNCKVVKHMNDALTHIGAHGSKHSECIVTQSSDASKLFQDSVDAAAVFWNASTRFNDGFELGLGGELGISNQKLHVRGPVGVRELTSYRWIIEGTGQIRK